MLLFHGCDAGLGHHWIPLQGGAYLFRYRVGNRIYDDPYRYVPWGYGVDGELAPQGDQLHVEGAAGFAQVARWLGTPLVEWWSALSWWDNSVDTRLASNATFVIDERVGPVELLSRARAAYPTIFERMKYQILLPAVVSL